MTDLPHGLAVVLGDPDPRWCVIQGWHDSGGAIAVYGPLDDEQTANALIEELRNHNIHDNLTAVSLRKVST